MATRVPAGRIAAMAGAVVLVFLICTLGCWAALLFGANQALTP